MCLPGPRNIRTVNVYSFLRDYPPYGRYQRKIRQAKRPQSFPPYGTIDESGAFHLRHDSGFFSNCSVTLLELARASRSITRIDTSDSFSWFKSEPGSDVWSRFFSDAIVLAPRRYGEWSERLLHHSRYRTIDLSIIQPLLTSYFHPSNLVLSRQRELLNRYDIDLSKTLAMNYRGTDKGREISLSPVEEWLETTRRALKKLPGETRLLIQTDQEQVRQRFLAEFPHQAFFFEEMPVTRGQQVIHEILDVEERDDFAVNLLASTLILANCNRLITHKGNVALWTVLFRGHSVGMTQV